MEDNFIINEDNLKKLYGIAQSKGMPDSYEDLRDYLSQSEDNRKKFYDKMSSLGMPDSYEDYTAYIGRVDVSDVEQGNVTDGTDRTQTSTIPTVDGGIPTVTEAQVAEMDGQQHYQPRVGGEPMKTPEQLEAEAREMAGVKTPTDEESGEPFGTERQRFAPSWGFERSQRMQDQPPAQPAPKPAMRTVNGKTEYDFSPENLQGMKEFSEGAYIKAFDEVNALMPDIERSIRERALFDTEQNNRNKSASQDAIQYHADKLAEHRIKQFRDKIEKEGVAGFDAGQMTKYLAFDDEDLRGKIESAFKDKDEADRYMQAYRQSPEWKQEQLKGLEQTDAMLQGVKQQRKQNFWNTVGGMFGDLAISSAMAEGGMSQQDQQQLVKMQDDIRKQNSVNMAVNQQLHQAENTLDIARKNIEEGEGNMFVKLGRGVRYADLDNLIPVSELYGQMGILQLYDKLDENGNPKEQLTDDEQTLYNALAMNQYVQQLYGDNVNMLNRIGKGLPEQAMFTLSFLLGSEFAGAQTIGRGATKAMQRGISNIVKKEIKSGVGKFMLDKALPTAFGMGAETLYRTGLQTGNIVSGAIERHVGTVQIDPETGEIGGFKGGVDWGEAMWKSTLSVANENLTELLGDQVFEPGWGWLGRNTKAGQRIADFRKTIGEIGDGRVDDILKMGNDISQKAGWNGWAFETLEELAGNFNDAAFIHDQTWEQAFSKETVMETVLNCMIFGMVMGSSTTTTQALRNLPSTAATRNEKRKAAAIIAGMDGISTDEIDNHIDNDSSNGLADWLVERHKAGNSNGDWTDTQRAAVANYVRASVAQKAQRHFNGMQLQEDVKKMEADVDEMTNNRSGNVIDANFEIDGQKYTGKIIGGRVSSTESDVVDADGQPKKAYTYNPYLSSATLSVIIDGTGEKKMIPSRAVTSINDITEAEQFKSERAAELAAAMQQSVAAMDEVTTVSDIWGVDLQGGVVLPYNGGSVRLDGKDADGNWVLTSLNPDGTPTEGTPPMVVGDFEFRKMGMIERMKAMQQQGASEEEIEDAVDDINTEQTIQNIEQSGNEDNIWDNIAGFMQGYTKTNEEGDFIPEETRPEAAAGYLVALQKGDIGKTIGIVDARIAELQTRLMAKPEQVENNGEGVVGIAANQSLADSTAEEMQKQIGFLEMVRNGLVAKQAEQAQMEAQKPVSQMEVGTEFPVMYDGQQAVAVVVGRDADGRNVVTIRDQEGNDLESGIDDWTDEQWERFKSRPEEVAMPSQQTEQKESAEIEQKPTEIEQNAPEIEQQEEVSVSPAQQTFDGLVQKYGDKAGHKIDVTAEDKSKTLDKAKKALEKAQTDYDDAPIGKEEKAEAALQKAQEEYNTALAEKQEWDEVKAVKDRFVAEQPRGADDARLGDLAQAEALNYPLSEETDEFGKPFIKAADGSTTFGEVTEDEGLTPAPIKLSLGENYKDEKGGNHGYGMLHIEAGHGEQIRKAGFATIEEFVEQVAKNYDTVREGGIIAGNQTYLLEISDEHNNTLFIQLSRDGSYWNINSAGIFKEKYSRRKPKVATRPALEPGTTADSSGVNNGETGAEPSPAGNSPTTSDGKGTENSETESEKQENISETAETPMESAGEGTELTPPGPLSEGELGPTDEAVAAANEEVDTNPTEAQKEAGNYKKGHVTIDGFDISIENPAGSTRSGTDAQGNPWSVTMHNSYGYIRMTEGVDGDHIDIFLSDHIDDWNGTVYVVDQVKEDGSFDEHKVMYGFNSAEEAREAYLSNYSEGWQGLGTITGVSREEFKKWVDSSHRKTKAFADYKSVQPTGGKTNDGTERTEQPVQPKKEKKESEFQKRITAVGEPRTLEEAILYDIAVGGAKFRWGNRNEDKAVVKRGIGDLWKYSNSEYKKRIGIVKKDGYSIETYAEAILAGQLQPYSGAVSQIAEQMDMHDIIGTIEDVLQMVTSRSGALQAIEEKRLAEAEEEENYIRSLKDAYANELGFKDFDEMEEYYTERVGEGKDLTDDEYYEISRIFAEQYGDSVIDKEDGQESREGLDRPADSETGTNEQSGVRGEGEGGNSLLQSQQTPSDEGREQPGQETGGLQGNTHDGTAQEPSGAAEVRDEIDKLKAKRSDIIRQRDDIQQRYEKANGLFGDTQADESDLFGGQNFLSPELAQATIDGYNRQIRQIDDRIAKLEASLKRAGEVKQTEIGTPAMESPENRTEQEEQKPTETREELDRRLMEERRQRILTEGTEYDKPFGLVPVSETMTVEDIDTNMQRIAEGLKANEGNKDFGNFYGFAYQGNFKENLGQQLKSYYQSLTGAVDPKTLMAWAGSHGFKTYDDVVEYGKGLYDKTDTTDRTKGTERTDNVMFSIDEPKKKETRKSLVGLHNINVAKLRKVLKKGGLANPSTAVIDIDKQDFTGYGEVSLVMPSSLVDSRTGNNAGTYLGDAWTPTYPSVETSLSKEGEKKVDKIASENSDGNEEVKSHIKSRLNDFAEQNGERLWYLFLKQTGRSPKLSMKRTNTSEESYEKLRDLIEGGIIHKNELTKEESDRIAEVIIDERFRKKDTEGMTPEALDFLVRSFNEKNLDEDGILYFGVWNRFIESLMQDERTRRNPKIDFYDTETEAQRRVYDEGLAGEYEQWKQTLFGDSDIDERLFAGFTPSGTRRYMANTPENASRIMNKLSETNSYDNGGLSATRASLLKKVKSLSDIRKNKELLKDGNEFEDDQKRLSDELFSIIEQVSDMQKLSDNSFINNDYAEARLQESFTKRDPIKHLNDEYGYDIDKDSDLAKQIGRFLDEVKSLPVKYFETKFRRPVYLKEFAAAVVPDDLPQDLKDGLRQSGLALYEYDPKDEGSRREATLKATEGEGIRFSVDNGTDVANRTDAADVAYNAVREALANAGIEVVEATEEDVKRLKDSRKQLKDSKGTIRGWVGNDGKIHLTKDGLTAETPIHEYTHLWAEALQMNNPELWEQIKGLLKDTPEWKRITSMKEYSNLKDDDRIAGEVLAHISGKKNAERMEAEAKRMIDEAPTLEEAAKAANLLGRMRDALKKFWTWVGKTLLGRKGNINIDQVSNMVLADLTNGVDPFNPRGGKRTNRTKRTDASIESEQNGLNDIERVNQIFNDELQQQMEGTLPSGHVYDMGMPSVYLRSTGIPNLPIRLQSSILNKKSDDPLHPYKLEEVKDLVKLIQKPLAIFAYGDKTKAQNLMIGISQPTAEGKQFLVGLALNPDVKGKTLEINSVRNVFPKNYHDWIHWIIQGKMLRVDDRESIKAIIDALRINPVDYISDNDLDSAANIVENFENPQVEGENFSDVDLSIVGPDNQIAKEFDAATGAKNVGFLKRKYEELHRGIVNDLRPLEQMQQLLEKALGRKLRDSEKAYELATHIISKSGEDIKRENIDYFVPMMQKLTGFVDAILTKRTLSQDLAYREVTDYMLAKHGLERNEWFHQQALANDPDAEEEDKAGLRGLAESLGENPDEYKAVAERIVKEFEDEFDSKDVDEFWKLTKALSDRILEIGYNTGMLKKDEYEDLKKRHRYYVPLRGFAEGTAAELYEYLVKSPQFQDVFKKAEGRESKADDPIANLYNMLQSAIVIGNQNKVMQNIYNLGVNAKSDLLRVNRSWYVYNDAKDKWEETLPDISEKDTPDEVDAEMKRFEAQMQQLKQQGKAKQYLNKMELGKRVLSSQYKEHMMVAYIDGQRVVMYVAGNPVVAQALNRANKKQLSKFMEPFQWLTRKYSALQTTYSPAFGFMNADRDIRLMLFSSFVTGGLNKMMRAQLNIMRSIWVLPRLIITGKMGGGITKMISKQEAANIEQWWDEFLRNGGETGFTRTLSAEKAKGEVQDMLRHMLNGSKDGENRVKKYAFGWIDFLSRYSEDISRFAAYCMQRAQGGTVLTSIDEAKNVTVNFNVHGGSDLAAWCRALFSFFNAAVQGVEKIRRLAVANPKRFWGGIAALMVGGAIVPWINMVTFLMFGGDDDDWRKLQYLSEYTANHYTVIFVGNHKFIKIPWTQELAPFNALGNIWFRQQMGWNNGRSVWEQWTDMFVDLLPISVGEGKKPISRVVKTIMPSFTQPVWEVLLNEDFTGSPIYKDNNWNKYDAGWEKAYEGKTSEWFIDASKWIYGNVKNPFNGKPIDINPAVAEHLLSGVLGGIGRSGDRLVRYFSNGFQLQDAPFIRTMMFDSNPQGYIGAVSREYGRLAYEVLPEVKHDVDRADMLEFARLANTQDYQIANVVSIYKTGKDLLGNKTSFQGIDKLEKEFKKAEKAAMESPDNRTEQVDEYLEAMRAQINEMKMEMLDAIDEVIYNNSGAGRRSRVDRVREIERDSKEKYQREHSEE